MSNSSYIQVITNSQYFTNIDQIIEFVKTNDLSDPLNIEYLIVALENTKNLKFSNISNIMKI